MQDYDIKNTWSLRVAGPKAEGVYQYQANHKCPCYKYYVTISYRLQTHVCSE